VGTILRHLKSVTGHGSNLVARPDCLSGRTIDSEDVVSQPQLSRLTIVWDRALFAHVRKFVNAHKFSGQLAIVDAHQQLPGAMGRDLVARPDFVTKRKSHVERKVSARADN
jgi:hypothetical protein